MASLLVAGVGFNESPIVRATVYSKPSTILLLTPKAEGEAAVRLERTVSLIRELASMIHADVRVVEVEKPADVGSMVFKVKRSMESLIESNGIERVYFVLRGGLRLFTLALLLTAQSMALSWQGEIKLILEDEAGSIIELDASQLVPERLTPEERMMLRLLAEKTLEGGELGVREAASILGMPKSTAHKRLKMLADRSLATRGSEGYRVTLKGLVTV